MSSTPKAWEFSQQFTSEFQTERTDIQSRLAIAQANPSQSILQELSTRVARLSKSLTDATGSLPSYDQNLYETQVKQLEQEIDSLRSNSSNKARFSFKRKAPAPAQSLPPPIASISPLLSTPVEDETKPKGEPSQSSLTSGPPSRNLTLQSHSYRYINASDLHLSGAPATPDLTISNLTNCIVNLLHHFNDGLASKPFGAYHIRNLTNCIVLLPFCPGSALIHGLKNSVLALGCHQFRMHDSQKVDIYLDIASNPVIENCQKIRFSMYPAKLNPDLLQRSPLPPFTIQDFSHIRASPSPNFSLMPDKLANESKPWPLNHLSTQAEIERGLTALLPGTTAVE